MKRKHAELSGKLSNVLGIEKNNNLSDESKAKGYVFDKTTEGDIGHQVMGFAGLMENILQLRKAW